MKGADPDRGPLRLRRWAPGDLDLLRRLLGDPALTVHLGGPETEEAMARRHGRHLALDDPSKGRMFVVEMESGRGDRIAQAVGSVGYWEHLEDDGSVVWETGWFVLPEFHGRGIATAATRLSIDAAWAAVARPMHAYPSVANDASNAVARKLGMRLLGSREFEYPKGHWMTCNDWVIEPAGQGTADGVAA